VLCAACPHRCPHGNASIEATPKLDGERGLTVA
jgi:hypothetical protein